LTLDCCLIKEKKHLNPTTRMTSMTVSETNRQVHGTKTLALPSIRTQDFKKVNEYLAGRLGTKRHDGAVSAGCYLG